MDEAIPKSTPFDICARCMTPVPRSAVRCPNCAMPHRHPRNTTLWLGVAVALAVVFVMAVMLYSIRGDDLANQPGEGAEQQQSAPAAPDKPPPLNQ